MKEWASQQQAQVVPAIKLVLTAMGADDLPLASATPWRYGRPSIKPFAAAVHATWVRTN